MADPGYARIEKVSATATRNGILYGDDVTRFDINTLTRSADEKIAATENPRHRSMLQNMRRHLLLEIAGRWREVLSPKMIVDHPVYHINEKHRSLVLAGADEVERFYDSMFSAGLPAFGPVEERIAVADWGIAAESLFVQPLPGWVLLEQGEELDDPGGWYELTHWQASFWPFDEQCRLLGEHIYEDVASREITQIDGSGLVMPEEAARILAPLLERETEFLDRL